MDNQIPDIVIGRLPLYLRELNRMAQEPDRVTASSHELAERLGISSAQIRKDLSHFGEFGKQGTGYHIQYLTDRLTEILHLTQEWPVVLVGAGFLGPRPGQLSRIPVSWLSHHGRIRQRPGTRSARRWAG